MVKYSSFLLIASICLFTVLCVSAASSSGPADQSGTNADPFNGNLETVFQALSNIDQSPNALLKVFRYIATKFIDYFEKDKEFMQNAVNEGTQMEKKIQSISLTLKNSTVTLPAELQSELEEIEKHAAAELKKLKGVENVKYIDEMHKHYKEKYTEFKEQIKAISNVALKQLEKDKAETSKEKQVNTQTANTLQSHALVSKVQSKDSSDAFVEEMKKLIIKFIKTWVPVAFTITKDTEAVSKKIDVASSVLSNIRNDLNKVEQMEYHLLREHKDLFKTDVAPLTRSSVVHFVFAVMLGMLF